MALNIFRTAAELAGEDTGKSKQFEGTVGSFRAGFLDSNDKPKSLSEWRVTTGDPEVAQAIHELLGGDAPVEWETKSEESLEVYTVAKSLTIVLDRGSVRQRFVQRNRNGEVVYTSDGAMTDKGESDPHATLTLDERLKLASDGLGPSLETTIWFKLDDSMGEVTLGGSRALAGDIGKFRYQSTGKSIGKQVDREQIEQTLEDAEGPVRAKLAIEHVSFTAKSGARAGLLVEYHTANLKILGPAR